MNKYKLLVAVAVAGLFGLSARASIPGYESVNIKCIILMQTNDTYPKATTTKFNVTKMKVTNKDILNLIAAGICHKCLQYWLHKFPQCSLSAQNWQLIIFLMGNFTCLIRPET